MTGRTKSFRRAYCVFLLAGTGLGLTVPTAAAFAQEQAGAPDAASSGGLEEIVVTAQKREQNLQETPIAVSAISADKVEQLGIQESRDLSGLAPNVTIMQPTTNNTAAVISIRGIPTPADENFGLDTSNALYVDGVYMARSAATSFEVLDISRVEVLRGPQGTLFGRNTTGGAISFITRDPSDSFHLTAQGGYGNYNAWNGKLILDPGDFHGLRTSFAYSHSQRDGVFDNITQPDDSKDPGARKSDSARFALMLPLGDTGSIRYAFDWTRIAGHVSPFQLTNVADGTPRAPILGVNAVQQAPVQQYLAGVTFTDPRCAALAAPRRAYRHDLCQNTDGLTTDKIWGHTLRVENEFGDVKIKLTTGWRMWRNRIRGTDLDGLGEFSGPMFSNATLFNGMPASLLSFIPTLNPPLAPAGTAAFIASQPVPRTTQGLFDTSNNRKQDQVSQEVEVSGRSDQLDWVVGGFYFWEEGSEQNLQNSGFVLDTNQVFLGNFGALGPAFAAANPARYRLVVTRSLLTYRSVSESTALYGQATFYPGGRAGPFNITVGGRYTWDNKQMTRTQNGAAPLPTPERGEASFSKFTWNIMAGYRAAEGINLYARAATGYRSGGFNARDDSIVGTTKLPSFKPESVTSYEIGAKTELFDRHVRLNVAAYYNNFSNLAVTVPVARATPGTFGTIVTNAGKVRYAGIEVEGQAVLNDNFSIDGSFGYVNVDYKQFLVPTSGAVGAPLVNIGSIVHPGYTSPYTANIAANAQFPIGGGDTKVRARVGYTYESAKYSFSHIITTPFNEQLKSDPRNLIDAQLGIEGLPIGGGTGEVKLWVKNLTNSHDFVRAVDFGQLGYGGGIYGDPRTYGVTFGMKF
ncbi:MAG: TonB-dependent receptor [Proteobacteria bacterium]|nr:TonB-dependent receptor [Pseudomonadota bacterium]